MSYDIILPSKPKVISEEGSKGIYEIDDLYPGYGHTLGNSLRRVILSSLPGVAITMVKVDGISHEFSTVEGVKEDVITILLNLKLVRFRMDTDGPEKVNLKISGTKEVTAKDITAPGQVEVVNKDQYICTVTGKNASLDIEMTLEKGLGFVSKEKIFQQKLEIGTIALDAIFTPIRRVNYEVENMRVGDRTDYNRLRMFIETDGIISPREALQKSIEIMIAQLQSVSGFSEHVEEIPELESASMPQELPVASRSQEEMMKIRIEDLGLSARTYHALSTASIRSVGGLARKAEDDLLEINGLGEKGISEIKRALSNYGITLRQP